MEENQGSVLGGGPYQNCEEGAWTTGGNITLDTKGSCFLCLQKISNGGGVEEIFSFRNLCRYLKIDQQLLFEKCANEHFSVNEMDAWKKKKIDFSVILCGRCSSVSRNLSDLICEREKLDMAMLHQLQEINQALTNPENQVLEGWRSLQNKMTSDSSNQKKVEASMVEQLRLEARLKCEHFQMSLTEAKLMHFKRTSLPKVELEQLNGDMINQTEQVPATTSSHQDDIEIMEHETEVEVLLLSNPSNHVIPEAQENDADNGPPGLRKEAEESPITDEQLEDQPLNVIPAHSRAEISPLSKDSPSEMSETIWMCEVPDGGCGQKLKSESRLCAHKKYSCPKRKAKTRSNLSSSHISGHLAANSQTLSKIPIRTLQRQASLGKRQSIKKSKRQKKTRRSLSASSSDKRRRRLRRRPNSLSIQLFPQIFQKHCEKVTIESGLYRCLLCTSGQKPGYQSVILRHFLLFHPEAFFPNNKKKTPNMSEKSFKEHCRTVIEEESSYKLINSKMTRRSRKPVLCAFCGVKVSNVYLSLKCHLIMEHHDILEVKLDARTRLTNNHDQICDEAEPGNGNAVTEETERLGGPQSMEMEESQENITNLEPDNLPIHEPLGLKPVEIGNQAEAAPEPVPSTSTHFPLPPRRWGETAHILKIVKKNCKKVGINLYTCVICNGNTMPKSGSISMIFQHLANCHPEVFFPESIAETFKLSKRSFKSHCRAVLEEKSNHLPASPSISKQGDPPKKRVLCSLCPSKPLYQGLYSNLKYHLILRHCEILESKLNARVERFQQMTSESGSEDINAEEEPGASENLVVKIEEMEKNGGDKQQLMDDIEIS